jgi:2-polyprenyl-3-methyl-5-hydroxy-6-metoxy-1,4-benzoquinol methylase
LPRVHTWLPTGTVLEIAPGFGRWSHFLKDMATRLILVDLTERCISECRSRFSAAEHITYHVNDGRSLSMIPDGTIDLAFSFDSLVHVEEDVIGAYLSELARTLSPDGVGFIHHSNLGAYAHRLRLARSLERLGWPFGGVSSALARTGLTALNPHWRAETVTAEVFRDLCHNVGLECRSQEIIPWGGWLLSDCISVFTRIGGRWARENQVFVNERFPTEAVHASTRQRLYGS